MTLRSSWRPSKNEVVAPRGIVTAMQPASAEAGLAMLTAGGNAVDAAVAMGFCNVVLEPYNATIGGMGYMLIHLAASGRTVGVDFNARAPALAREDMFEVLGPAPAGGIAVYRVAGGANEHGPLSVTVPATCAGFCAVHERFGRLPLAQVLEPAIALATDGFEADWYTTLFLANRFDEIAADSYLASFWLPDGKVPRSDPKPGRRIIQRELGDLLRRIGQTGASAMYAGEVAAEIHTWMAERGGILSREDLATYRPTFAEPFRRRFAGRDLACVATPSGAITSLQLLGILDRLNLGGLSHNTAPYLHLLIEAARHAFADRYRWLGDWDHAAVPLSGLLSDPYAAAIAGQIIPSKTAFGPSDDEPWSAYAGTALHDPWSFQSERPTGAPQPTAVAAGTETTTHFNAVDEERNVVTCTHTGAWSDVHPPGTGVYLTHGMAWFAPIADHANSIAAWKRPMNNMCPIMVLENGRPIIVQGAPGARKIIHRGVQLLLNQLHFGMRPQDAIDALTIDASGRKTLVDSRMPSPVIDQLRSYGHDLSLVDEQPGMLGNFSRPSAVRIDYEAGTLSAGVDPFRPAMALGY